MIRKPEKPTTYLATETSYKRQNFIHCHLCAPCNLTGLHSHLLKLTAGRERPLGGGHFTMPTDRSWLGRAAGGRNRCPPTRDDPTAITGEGRLYGYQTTQLNSVDPDRYQSSNSFN